MNTTFSVEKAVEASLYLANEIKALQDVQLYALLYCADKTSLEEWGRFICGERYHVSKLGPVPFHISKMMTESKSLVGFDSSNDMYTLRPTRKANIDHLSESDVMSLDATIKSFGSMPTWCLLQITRDEAYHRACETKELITEIDVAQFMAHSEELIEYLQS